jgi:hypothetical protein
MQQRQPRLGDILDDYCPRERRVTNHVVVAMVDEDVKQTRCTTCDADHEYKHAKVPRQRRKDTAAALHAQVLAGGPKRVVHESPPEPTPQAEASAAGSAGVRIGRHDSPAEGSEESAQQSSDGLADHPEDDPAIAAASPQDSSPEEASDEPDIERSAEEGPAHRRLIRATLPRVEGQQATRPGPDFTIRQPNSRQRFRNPRGGSPFHNSNRSGNPGGGDAPRLGNRHPPMASRPGTRHGSHQGGRKRSK